MQYQLSATLSNNASTVLLLRAEIQNQIVYGELLELLSGRYLIVSVKLIGIDISILHFQFI
jgi:hypothetical protein